MSLAVFECPECGCLVSSPNGLDARVLCPDCTDKIVCTPTAVEYLIENLPAAGPWQTEEPLDGENYLFKRITPGGEAMYMSGKRINDFTWMWANHSWGMVYTKEIVAWARLNTEAKR